LEITIEPFINCNLSLLKLIIIYEKTIYKTKKIIYNITSFKGNDEEVVVI